MVGWLLKFTTLRTSGTHKHTLETLVDLCLKTYNLRAPTRVEITASFKKCSFYTFWTIDTSSWVRTPCGKLFNLSHLEHPKTLNTYTDASDTNEEAPLLGGRSSTTSSSSNRLQPEYPNNHSQYGSGMTTAYNNHICSFAPTAAAPLVPETACGYQQDDGSTDSGPALLLSRSAPAPSVATGNFQYEDETTPIAFDRFLGLKIIRFAH